MGIVVIKIWRYLLKNEFYLNMVLYFIIYLVMIRGEKIFFVEMI